MSEKPAWDVRVMHLRLLIPDDVSDVAAEIEPQDILLRRSLTLCEYAEHYLFPKMQANNRNLRTIERLRDSLKWWRVITGDPALAKISDFDIDKFGTELRKKPGRRGETLATETVRQTLARVRSVMNRASRRHVLEGGTRLTFLESVPEFELPDKTRTPKEAYTREELNKILEAAAEMSWPNIPGVPSKTWWRSLWQYLYNEARRIGETLQLEYAFLRGRELRIPDSIAKHGHGTTLCLQDESLKVLERIRTPRKYIFALPSGHLDKWTLNRETQRLLELADVYQVGRLFHGTRHTKADEAYERGGQAAAQKILDHNDPRTTDAYISDKVRQLRDYELKKQLPRLRDYDNDDGQQLRLPFAE